MCPQCELGLLPLRPQTSIKYLFNLATWRRPGREWDRRDAATLASINFSNLSDNIKASGFIFQRRLITILMPLQSHIKQQTFQQLLSLQNRIFYWFDLNVYMSGRRYRGTGDTWGGTLGSLDGQSCFPEHSTRHERWMMKNTSSFCAPLPPTRRGIL